MQGGTIKKKSLPSRRNLRERINIQTDRILYRGSIEKENKASPEPSDDAVILVFNGIVFVHFSDFLLGIRTFVLDSLLTFALTVRYLLLSRPLAFHLLALFPLRIPLPGLEH